MPQEAYDVIIVGAGPAGLSAAARAHQSNLTYLVLEQGKLANTLEEEYQDEKHVMALPVLIPLRSDLAFAAGSREAVLGTWGQYTVEQHLNIRTQASVEALAKNGGLFEITTKDGQIHTAKHVVLAIGKLGNPRTLDVPGAKPSPLPRRLRRRPLERGREPLTGRRFMPSVPLLRRRRRPTLGPQCRPLTGRQSSFPFLLPRGRRRPPVPVSYRLRSPKAFHGKDILVVGGGDSAAEVVLALSAHNRVVMSYRKGEFSSMNDSLRSEIEQKMRQQEITVYFNTEVEGIKPGFVLLRFKDNRQMRIKVDHIFAKIGADIPRAFLERCGVTFPAKHITALPEINERYESRVPGLFLIGAVGGKDLIKHAMNQGYDVIEHILGHAVTPVDEKLLEGCLQGIPGASVDAQLTHIASAVPLLAHIPRQRLRELVLESTCHFFAPGHTIFQEGHFSTTLYTIVDGSVKISQKADPARKITRHKGEFFGEMALISDQRRSATVTTTEPSILLDIPRRTVLRLLQTEPSVQRLIDEAYALRTLQTYLAPDLSEQDFDEVVKKAVLKTLQKDDVLFRDGDPGDAFYVIRSGSVKISKRNTEGKEYVLTYRRVGEYVGEMALLDERRNVRMATVTAATRTEVIRIGKDDFLKFLAKQPHLREQIQSRATQRAQGTDMILAAPRKEALADFMTHGVIESTDVLLIDETKCIRCDNCVKACAATHNGQTRLERVAGPSFTHLHVPVSCRHCEGAPCLQDCPPGDAIVRDATGVVQIYEDKCIGCGNCARYCPYGVISMVEAPQKRPFWDRFNLLDLLRGRQPPAAAAGAHHEVAIKCDLCKSIDVKHDMVSPACVENCPTGAAIRVRPEYFGRVEFP